MPSVLDRLALLLSAFGAGVAVGLLIAPAPGDATRQRLATSARETADAARHRASGLAEPVAEAARERARRLAERHVPLADDFDVVDGRDLLDDLNAGRD